MKKLGMLVGTVCLAFGLQTAALAQGQPAGTPAFGATATGMATGPAGAMNGHGMGGARKGYHPCIALEKACKTGGYTKNLWKTCIKPLIDGGTVSGVEVESTDVVACKQNLSQKSRR